MTLSHESASCLVQPCTAVPQDMREGLLELTKLYVPIEDRRKGYATALLSSVCEQADGASKTLLVVVSPYGDPDLGKTQLADWYKRFGFIEIQEDPQILARVPGSTPRLLEKPH